MFMVKSSYCRFDFSTNQMTIIRSIASENKHLLAFLMKSTI